MKGYRKPHRIKKKRSILKNRFFWLAILILIIFSGFFYFICFHSFFQVKVIEIFGNQKISTEDLKNLLNERINQKVLFFPSKSIFLINLKTLKEEILKKFPQIEKVSLNRKFPNSLVLEIKEREPIAVFCSKDEQLNCFFIDKGGIVFEITAQKKDFPLLKKELNKEINLGEKIIDEEQLLKILDTQEKLKNELKIFLEEILLVSEEKFTPLESPFFLTGFNIKTSENWQIYFNLKEDLNWQLTKLKAVLEKEIPVEKWKDLEYIDVRFGNFAPYKYR